jgi:hypothetical protein
VSSGARPAPKEHTVSVTRFTLIDEQAAREIDADVDGAHVTLSPQTVADVLGWKLEKRGLCRGDVCTPLGAAAGSIDERGIDLGALADTLQRPLALDVEQRVAALAAPSSQRAQRLARLEAPDFTLPDLQGRLHSLQEHRGKKVLLIAHASW